MPASVRALRDHAAAMRRAADRFMLIRLRLGHAISDAVAASDPAARRAGADVQERWSRAEDAELGRVAAGLRTGAAQLEEIATRAERDSGRRLGGYRGAAFLGRGDDAVRHIGEVARSTRQLPGPQHGETFVGPAQGASIGGFPLAPSAESMLPHPSQTVGEPTPDYDEPD